MSANLIRIVHEEPNHPGTFSKCREPQCQRLRDELQLSRIQAASDYFKQIAGAKDETRNASNHQDS